MRVENWESELAQAFADTADREFQWGKFDCVTWAGEVIQRIGGEDYMRGFRGRYRSEKGAMRVIREEGCADLLELLRRVVPHEIRPAFAQRGDLIAVQGEDSVMAGICFGAFAAVPTDKGVATFKPDRWVAAWRIERE